MPKVIDRFKINNHQVLIYTQVNGRIIKNPSLNKIAQVAIFLKKFHSKSKNIRLTDKKKFTKNELKRLIILANNKKLYSYFKKINITLNNDGIIHGDLFVDNCKFNKQKLNGVYDFSDFCLGDFYFDLAVVAIDWCFDKDFLNRKKVIILLKSYQSKIKISYFINYIEFALLFYATIRFVDNRDNKELMQRLKKLNNN